MSFDLGDLPSSRFDVSVLIPVEFHRGQAISCIRGWTIEQDYPAEQYQIILCAPDTLSPDLDAEIRSMLRPWDRLERRPYHHDMSLVVEAACLAESELLFFTESHCIPESTALSQLIAEAKRHPEWSGFSCQTIPITHNLLSEIEAEIYAAHIEKELTSTRGVKVIDQCFLVDRTAYFKAGGFRPSFGHFAEWLLAAEIQKLGFIIGFSSIQAIKHYYVGDVDDLEAFTLDFAKGHIKYLAEFNHESTSTYFPAIPELNEYVKRSRADYRLMAKMKTIALPIVVFDFIRKLKNGDASVPLTSILLDWFESVFTAFSARSILFFAFWSAYNAKRRVFQSLKAGQREHVKAAFVDWFARLVHLGRVQYLLDNPSIQNHHVRNQNYPISDEINFTVDSQLKTAVEFLGFYDHEESLDSQRFRWSKNNASVWLPMHEGAYQLVVKWDKVRPINSYDLLNVNFDGRPIPVGKVTLSLNELIIEVAVETKAWCRLDWSVTPFPTNGDRRVLGLPITSIRWVSVNHVPDSQGDGALAKTPAQPVYFLHVPKCAGTSLRLVLDNTYQSSAIMSPYSGKYYPDDLLGIESERVFAYYRGHFRWALPAALSDQNLQVITVLRDPLDRILSRFYYLKQHGFIHESKSFIEWFEHDFKVEDTLTVHFLAQKPNNREIGPDSVKQLTLELVEEAQANLDKCLAVGVMEHMEDSVNIFAWHLGFLPPKILSKNNPTLVRDSVNAISDELRLRIEQTLSADMVLYRQAQKMFESNKSVMLNSIGLDVTDRLETVTVRNFLRQQYVNQLCKVEQNAHDPIHVTWTPEDIFHGENLHARELSKGKCLRWTGPETTTNFYVYLGKPCSRSMTIMLHPATPRDHAESILLSMNGLDISVKISYMASGEIKVEGNLTEEMCIQSANNVAEFSITTATAQGEGEFRMLGVALTGMSILAV